MTILPSSTQDGLEKALLQLSGWPPLTRLPPEADRETVARLCALLACKPTMGFMVGPLLALPLERVRPALATLYRHGCLRMLSVAVLADAAAEEGPGATVPGDLPPDAFISRLRNHFARP
jgi:hypothetical protein